MKTELSAYRADLSAYHHPDFRDWERERLERISGVTYSAGFRQDQSNVMLTNTHTRFDTLPRQELKGICLIVHANSGYDNIPVEFARNADFDIIVGNPIRAQAVASYVLSQIFLHYNPAPSSPVWQAGRQWVRKPMDSLTVLLLGFGHIGKIVHASLAPVVNEIIVHDPFLDMSVANLSQRLGQVDIVIPLMSLNPTSRGLISSEFLAALKQDFVLVNGARGGLVDQASLISMLRQRPGAFAYLDVFDTEPFAQAEFEDLSNVRLSSHVAGVFTGIDQKIIDFEAQVIGDYVSLTEEAFKNKYHSLVLRNRICEDFLI